MQTTMLKAKLHKVHVTHSELEYEGSCAIDSEFLECSGIREYEQIHIYNVNTGQRFTTYAIQAEKGSRTISVNGAAARLAAPGDKLIVCSYVNLEQNELVNFKPTLVYFDDRNQITKTSHDIPVQVA